MNTYIRISYIRASIPVAVDFLVYIPIAYLHILHVHRLEKVGTYIPVFYSIESCSEPLSRPTTVLNHDLPYYELDFDRICLEDAF